jgi:hypothetical protein
MVVLVREATTGPSKAMVIFHGVCCRPSAIRKTMSGFPEAAVIFGRGMLAWYWWFGSANYLFITMSPKPRMLPW